MSATTAILEAIAASPGATAHVYALVPIGTAKAGAEWRGRDAQYHRRRPPTRHPNGRALLGYSVEELRAHLEAHFEPGMSWGNYGKGIEQWSIDHSRPISSFPVTATLAEINAIENLRPMWHRKNCAKKNKWDGR